MLSLGNAIVLQENAAFLRKRNSFLTYHKHFVRLLSEELNIFAREDFFSGLCKYFVCKFSVS